MPRVRTGSVLVSEDGSGSIRVSAASAGKEQREDTPSEDQTEGMQHSVAQRHRWCPTVFFSGRDAPSPLCSPSGQQVEHALEVPEPPPPRDLPAAERGDWSQGLIGKAEGAVYWRRAGSSAVARRGAKRDAARGYDGSAGDLGADSGRLVSVSHAGQRDTKHRGSAGSLRCPLPDACGSLRRGAQNSGHGTRRGRGQARRPGACSPAAQLSGGGPGGAEGQFEGLPIYRVSATGPASSDECKA
mmetsp:Transcript_28126/g.61405  ORF Transcript_28126/g.61405 Transcript_28126/m.61405 type:complete len:243 (-) Transcript_28126:1132-1860(-)